MDLFKKAFQDVTPALDLIAKKSKQALNQISAKIIETSKVDPIEKNLIEVHPRIFWMNFPDNDLIVPLSKFLTTKFGNNFFIWNVSEHKYDMYPFNYQVAEHQFPGYPNPTLTEIFLICKSVISWLNNDQSNVAVIHCQNTRGRSALIISCILCLLKVFTHPGEALTYFCKKTKTKDVKILFPSQQLYLNYFANIMTGVKLNSKPLKIIRIIFSEIPKISRKSEKGQIENSFRPYLQLFKESQILYNSLNHGKLVSYYDSDLCIWFDLGGIQVKDDILIRCKHFFSNDLRYPIFRVLINTNFVMDNVLRLLKKDIDFTGNATVSDKFFIDIIFDNLKEGEDKSPQKEDKNSLEYIVNECTRKIEEGQKPKVEDNTELAKEKEIESILKNDNHEEQKDSSRFAINDEHSLSEGRVSDVSSEKSEDKPEEKNEIVNKLLHQLDQDQELNEQDIDDYMENLEKNIN